MDVIVIGAGYWGQNYIRELGGNLVGVIEPNKDRAEYISKTYSVTVFSPEDLDSLTFDGAIIATPPSNHMFYAQKLLQQDKYVLVEKPMAESMHQAFAVKNMAERLMVSNVYLYHPMIQQLRQRVVSGGFDIDHAFSRRTNDGPVRPWGNAAWDLAWHDIAIFNYIFDGVPIHVTSFGTRSYAFFRLEYVAREAVIYVSWVGSPKVRRLELVPMEGERVIFDDVATVLEVSPLRLMLDDFLNGAWDDDCSYDAALNVMTVLEATFLPKL